MSNALGIVIEREYIERVRRKSFIITTILVPIIMIALMLAPAAIMYFSSPESKSVMVLDRTGRIASRLNSNDEIKFVSTNENLKALRDNEDNEAILVINDNAIENTNNAVTLYTRGSLSMMTDAYITGQLNRAIEDARLEKYDLPDIRKILDEVHTDISMSTIRIDKEEEKETSSSLSYILSLSMDMLLYMFILIYGQMVMTSIIEEKNNRVLELVVSSVRPFQLMLGKIMGVGLVAITQILIWAFIIGAGITFIAPMMTEEIMASPDASPEITGAISQITDAAFLIQTFIYTILFFIGGFLFYSSIFAAIGSAVSNVQDASQLSSIATMPIIIGVISSMAIMNDPDSSLAFWVSIIPFTSPMSMMSRLPYGIAGWEIALSLVILYISFIFMIWLCGKIYRVGIFMYGKKPSLIEILKWAKYK